MSAQLAVGYSSIHCPHNPLLETGEVDVALAATAETGGNQLVCGIGVETDTAGRGRCEGTWTVKMGYFSCGRATLAWKVT
jgi:hypothetical protein